MAAALLFPIDWPEPFGLVMIEAMACGTPVIAYRSGSVPEVIEHGVTGLLAEGNDNEAALADTLAQLMTDAQQRVLLGRQAREAMRQYAPHQIMNEWESLFYKAIS